jgi:hypothetical protein
MTLEQTFINFAAAQATLIDPQGGDDASKAKRAKRDSGKHWGTLHQLAPLPLKQNWKAAGLPSKGSRIHSGKVEAPTPTP